MEVEGPDSTLIQPSADGVEHSGGVTPCAPPKPKIRPIQMGECIRKWVSKRLLRLNGADVSKTMVAMRQLGVGIAGGAEALAIFKQLIFQ